MGWSFKSFLILSLMVLVAKSENANANKSVEGNASEAMVELGDIQGIVNSLNNDVSKLKQAAKNAEKLNAELKKTLNLIQGIDVQKWSLALIDSASEIKVSEAEKKFINPKNEVEKILAALLLRTKSILTGNSQSAISAQAKIFIENEVLVAIEVFVRSLNKNERLLAVIDNPLAFGSEVDVILRKKFDDTHCTKERYQKALKKLISNDKRKNIILLLSPYTHYQNKYYLSYLYRLLALSKEFKHEKSLLVQNALSAYIIQATHPRLKELNYKSLLIHENQVRKVLGNNNLSSEQIEALERYIVNLSTECYNNGFVMSNKVRKFLLEK